MRSLVLAILVVTVGTAHADPTFAIDLRSKDAPADKITEALEGAMRANTKHYRSKGTHHDRVAASTDTCPSARTLPCAAEIGERLGVDYMFVGDVGARGNRYELTLDVVSVATKQRVRSLRDVVMKTTRAATWAKRVFERIVDKETGSLAVACNAPHASVFVDGQLAAELYQKRGTITGLALGRHAIEVRAPDFKPYVDDDVNVDGTTTLEVLLDPQ